MGSFARKMTDEERKIFQSLVDEGFTQIQGHHSRGPAEVQARSRRPGQTRHRSGLYRRSGPEASGLIDKIGFVEDAVDRAIRLAQLDKDDVQVVKYKAEPRLSDLLFGAKPAAAVARSGCAAGGDHPPRLLSLHLAARPGRQRQVARSIFRRV